MSEIKINRGSHALGEYFQPLGPAAKRLGISSSHFSLLLSGKRLPSIELAAKIEELFGVPCRFWAEELTIIEKTPDTKKTRAKRA
jgi:transcriptional regulator with XRE-family HTH domain